MPYLLGQHIHTVHFQDQPYSYPLPKLYMSTYALLLGVYCTFFNAFSMLSFGILAAFALFKTAANLLFTEGSVPPDLAEETISSDILEYKILFLASLAPFVCFTLLHLL